MTEFDNDDRLTGETVGVTEDDAANSVPSSEEPVELPALGVEDEVYGVTAEDKFNEAAEGHADEDWAEPPGLRRLLAFLETKTVWHPVGI